MSYQQEKNGEVVIYGGEQGIQPSPHKGLANIQNANISTETGEIMASFGRIQSNMTRTTGVGTLSFVDSSHVSLNIDNTNNKFKGMWITVTDTTHGGELANGNYWVTLSTGSSFVLSSTYGGAGITGFTAGLTANFTLIRSMSKPIAYTTETYFNGGTQFYRYYVLDNAGLVWMYDTVNDVFPSDDQQYWALPDISITYWSPDATPSGLTVINGTLLVFSGNKIWVKSTVKLNASYGQMTNALMMSSSSSLNPHFGFTGHQGRAYYTDGSFIGSIFPDTSLITGVANIQSYASYTTSTTTGTISNLFSGTIPSTGANVSATGFSRIPVVFFTATGGSLPAAITANVVYYIEYSTANATFQVFSAITGGVAIDITTGASGIQYYNTFWLIGTHAGAYGDHATMVFSPQRMQLPNFEVAQCIAEVSNTAIIGTKSSAVYPWNQVDNTPSGIINLPEQNSQQLLTVNQMVYIFAGTKGNVYITDGSVASLVIKVPDYCAGIAGTPSSYIEPKFTWGGVAYIRGRVYFSILDQTLLSQSSTEKKAGNCGGIWSFVPTQNLYIGQDTGIGLRLENQNSYGTYSGYATIIIPFFDQTAGLGPQYFSGWQSTITSSPSYGIDSTSTNPVGTVIVETDLIPVGTMLRKYTPKQIEYKMAAPLAGGETVQLNWRVNATDAWASCGTVIKEGNTAISGYFNGNFQGAQWVQLQAVMTPLSSSSTSFCRLSQIMMR